jgi:ribonuclease-3
MGEASLDRLQEALGYHFHDPALLMQALTHSSRKADLRCSNERMEFLGDAILGAAISDHLYHRFGAHTEGELTRLKSIIVSRDSLARAAREMNLGPYLLVAKGVAAAPPGAPEDGEGAAGQGGLPPSLLANAMEAIIAAVYLDGGIRAAYKLILRHCESQIERACRTFPGHNYKSTLQEFVQRTTGATPVYKVTAETGPDHGKSFEVVTIVADKSYGTGRGRTKKEAEQMAAQLTLEMLGYGKPDGASTSAESAPPEEKKNDAAQDL